MADQEPKKVSSISGKVVGFISSQPTLILLVIVVLVIVIIYLIYYYKGILGFGPVNETKPDPKIEHLVKLINSTGN